MRYRKRPQVIIITSSLSLLMEAGDVDTALLRGEEQEVFILAVRDVVIAENVEVAVRLIAILASLLFFFLVLLREHVRQSAGSRRRSF